MNLRDWLIVVGVVIIVGILIDGYRRMRLAKKDSLKMSLEMGGNFENTPLDDGFNPELPGGGARVIGAVEGVCEDENSANQTEIEQSKVNIGTQISADDTLGSSFDVSDIGNAADTNNDLKSSSDLITALSSTDEHEFESNEAPLVADSGSRIEVAQDLTAKPKTTKPKQVAKARKITKDVNKEDDHLVIVINVHSKEGSFPGIEIKKLLEACGLDHGDMSIFHRHEEDDLLSPIQFSVANAIEPGYFDPETLENIATPGVSFFMSLPGPKNYMQAFDYMLETAQCFARNLKGDLKDQNRSIMTAQTIEHCRHQVKEFERKQLSKNRV